MRYVTVILLLSVGACGDDEMASMSDRGGDCPDNSSTVALAVLPQALARGAAETIEVTWELTMSALSPAVTLRLDGDQPVEVDLPLTGDGTIYSGSLLNPFGLGVPAGRVSVLAHAEPATGCTVSPTAAASFVLE